MPDSTRLIVALIANRRRPPFCHHVA